MMLQDLQKHKKSIEYLMEALKYYENLFGSDNLQIGVM